MLTKNNAKFIKSLQLKKYRQKETLFIVEGEKNTVELLRSNYEIQQIVCSQAFLSKYEQLVKQHTAELIIAEPKQIQQLGTYKTNEQAVAIVKEPKEKKEIGSGFQILLDDIRDPGNLGTIIRIADWYGIKQVICSETTAEFFNPKTISASMGSIFRTDLIRTDLALLLKSRQKKSYGALLDGKNIHQIKFPKEGYILIGNESNGIKEELIPLVDEAITIPRLGAAESLNAAIATGIICDNIFRNS